MNRQKRVLWLAFTQSTHESLCPTCGGGANFSMENSRDVGSISANYITSVTMAAILAKMKQNNISVIL
jgi:hypothetical protein